MDTSNPSRPKGKGAALKTAGRTAASQAFLVTLSAQDDAPLFAEKKVGRSGKPQGAPTALGKILSDCWRILGENRPSLETDDFSLGPRTFRGILRIKTGPGALTLPAAMRLFKALSSRALASGNADATGSSLWKKGYAEKPLATLKQVVEARAALKGVKAG